jgi:hypothetical protein
MKGDIVKSFMKNCHKIFGKIRGTLTLTLSPKGRGKITFDNT